MKGRTVVKVNLPVTDDDGNLTEETEEVEFFLLHWGLHMEFMQQQQTGDLYPVTYTVGICQHVKTGMIKIFAPEELTVIGYELK